MARKLLALFAVSLLLFPMWLELKAGEPFTLVIDAGHGGKDPGAKGKIINEKEINLKIALKLGQLVRSNHPDVKVVYTRSTDKFVELDERAEIANRNKADLFISIHTNAVAKGNSVKGTETYTLGLARTEENLAVAMRENSAILLEDDYQQRYEGFDPNSSESYIIFEFMQNKHVEQSIGLASEVQRYFTKANRLDRGVRQAGFLVLRKTSMPSVLIEVGFISNSEEERFLASADGQAKLARSISNAFDAYKKTIDARKGALLVKKTPDAPASSKAASTTVQSYVDNLPASGSDNPPPGSEEDIMRRKQMKQNTSSAKPVQPSNQNGGKAVQTQPSKGQVVYKIRILSSDKKLPANSRLLKGYKNVTCVKGSRFYKYYYGETTSFDEIKKLRRQVAKDFKDAYIEAFKDGKSVKY